MRASFSKQRGPPSVNRNINVTDGRAFLVLLEKSFHFERRSKYLANSPPKITNNPNPHGTIRIHQPSTLAKTSPPGVNVGVGARVGITKLKSGCWGGASFAFCAKEFNPIAKNPSNNMLRVNFINPFNVQDTPLIVASFAD